jgi:hypothetical protein
VGPAQVKLVILAKPVIRLVRPVRVKPAEPVILNVIKILAGPATPAAPVTLAIATSSLVAEEDVWQID